MTEDCKQIIKKRKRENETKTKKWTDQEVIKILSYMQTHRNIEKPTAQLYYKKLIESTGIDAAWNLFKCKVRHLKGTLQKADDWSRSTGVGIEDGDGSTTVRDKMLKICPHYDQLSHIFSETREIAESVVDTSQHDAQESSAPDGTQSDTQDMGEGCNEIFILDDGPTTSSTAPSTALVQKVKHGAQNNCMDKLAETEAERMNFRKNQLEFEKERFEWTKEMETKEWELERQKQNDELKLKKMELEQNERLKMYKLELKYKTNK